MRIFITLFLFVSVTVLNAQTFEFKGKLLDKETHDPIIYANLSFLNTEKGISTTEEGKFSMYINQEDLNAKIHISCLNYKDTIISVKSLMNKTIFLSQKSEVLQEIILTNLKQQKVELDPVKRKVYPLHSRGLRMIAKYFPNTKKNECCQYLSKIKIQFPKDKLKKSKFRVRIFDKDSETGLPRNDLLVKNIAITIDKELKNATKEINLEDEFIKIPEDGFFIAIEKLFIPYNKYYELPNDTLSVLYSPVLGLMKSKYKNSNQNYTFSKGKWIKPSYLKQKGISLSISAILSN